MQKKNKTFVELFISAFEVSHLEKFQSALVLPHNKAHNTLYHLRITWLTLVFVSTNAPLVSNALTTPT